jgi:membrane protein
VPSLGHMARTVARRLAAAGGSAATRAAASRGAAEPEPQFDREPGRSHIVEKPHLLSASGWREVAVRIWGEITRDRLLLIAAGVAFFVMLAIFPALSVLVAVWGLFGNPKWVADSIGEIAFVLPPGGVELLRNQIDLVAAGGRHDLTLYIAGGLLIALWSANAGMKSMIDAMNLIYDEDEKRGFFALNFRSLLFTLGALAIFLATILFLVAVPIFMAWAKLPGAFLSALSFARWPALFVITVAFLTLLNRYGPSRAPTRARWSVWGSTLGAFMWLAVSLGFSFYVGHIANLAATYGSIAAIAGLMTWLWLSALVILIGVELNAELEHRTERWNDEQRRRLAAAAPRKAGASKTWRRWRS